MEDTAATDLQTAATKLEQIPEPQEVQTPATPRDPAARMAAVEQVLCELILREAASSAGVLDQQEAESLLAKIRG